MSGVSELDLSGLVLISAVAFAAPLLLGLAPALRLPSVVLEIVAGITIGPSGFGWVEVDQPIEVLALIGLAFLLFLSDLEIDFEKLRGRQVGLAVIGAMVLPWVSTKADDPTLSARFGIGQKTLRGLGGPIAAHCNPYHFQMDETPLSLQRPPRACRACQPDSGRRRRPQHAGRLRRDLD